MSLERRRLRRGRPGGGSGGGGDTKDAIDVAVLEDEKEDFARAAASLVRDILEEFDSFERQWKESLGGQDSPPTPFLWMARSGIHHVTVKSWLK